MCDYCDLISLLQTPQSYGERLVEMELCITRGMQRVEDVDFLFQRRYLSRTDTLANFENDISQPALCLAFASGEEAANLQKNTTRWPDGLGVEVIFKPVSYSGIDEFTPGLLGVTNWQQDWQQSAPCELSALYFIGPRPSELEETRLIHGRHPVARIEVGKLRGRANRTVALMPAAVAWLKKAGIPTLLKALTREMRRPICKLAGVKWKADISRHTYISSRTKT